MTTTTESGGRQNMFPTETRPYIDESISYESYAKNAEKINGRWAMLGLVACLYLTLLLGTSSSVVFLVFNPWTLSNLFYTHIQHKTGTLS